jgi:hypothetical protein
MSDVGNIGETKVWIETDRIFVVSCASYIRPAKAVGRGLKPGHAREGSHAVYIVVQLSHSLLDALEGE